MTELNPCPFCGKKPKVERSLMFDGTYCYKHQCKDGKRLVAIEGYLYCTRKEAADEWNRRAGHDGR